MNIFNNLIFLNVEVPPGSFVNYLLAALGVMATVVGVLWGTLKTSYDSRVKDKDKQIEALANELKALRLENKELLENMLPRVTAANDVVEKVLSMINKEK